MMNAEKTFYLFDKHREILRRSGCITVGWFFIVFCSGIFGGWGHRRKHSAGQRKLFRLGTIRAEKKGHRVALVWIVG
jgi:hypothetical protein